MSEEVVRRAGILRNVEEREVRCRRCRLVQRRDYESVRQKRARRCLKCSSMRLYRLKEQRQAGRCSLFDTDNRRLAESSLRLLQQGPRLPAASRAYNAWPLAVGLGVFIVERQRSRPMSKGSSRRQSCCIRAFLRSRFLG